MRNGAFVASPAMRYIPGGKMSIPFDAVILAAGKGTRMKSRVPKVLHGILGYPLIEYVVRTVSSLDPERIIVVVGYGAERVREYLSGRGLFFVEQAKQLGTVHALRVARDAVVSPRFLVLPGDVPLVPRDALDELLREHFARGALASFLTFSPPEPEGYGRVLRDESGIPAKIVDGGNAPAEPLSGEVVSGIYCMENAPELWEALEAIPKDAQGECSLTDLIPALYPRVWALEWHDPDLLRGVDTRADLTRAEGILRDRIVRRLQSEGVTVVDPAASYIGPDVSAGIDTIIHPGTHIYGRTGIGEACEIGPNAYIVDSRLGDRVRVWFSVLEGAWVDEGTSIGPYAHLRPGARIGKGARIGNFVEVKNAEIGDGVRAGHLAYIGDAEVGEGTNIGAGTITCNYDGIRKHRTVIGKGAFIGSNTALVAPVTIGEGAVIGAGSVITEDVPPYALALGRARQVVKPDWARRRAEEGREG